jgi:hypothetical protein
MVPTTSGPVRYLVILKDGTPIAVGRSPEEARAMALADAKGWPNQTEAGLASQLAAHAPDVVAVSGGGAYLAAFLRLIGEGDFSEADIGGDL